MFALPIENKAIALLCFLKLDPLKISTKQASEKFTCQ